MPNAQNSVLPLYGPWKGQDDRDSRTDTVEFERCINIEADAEELRTRPGRSVASAPSWTNAATITAIGRSGPLVVTAVRIGDPPSAHFPALRFGTTVAVEEWKYPYAHVNTGEWTEIVPWIHTGLILLGEGVMLAQHGGGPMPPFVFTNATETLAPLACVAGSETNKAYLTALPPCSTGAHYHMRLYLASGRTVLVSEYDNSAFVPSDGSAPFGGANVWPAGNDFDAAVSETDEIVKLITYGDQLIIFTKEGVFVWDDTQVRRVRGAPGCVSADSVAETPRGLVYLATDGIRVFDGDTTLRVSPRVESTLYGAPWMAGATVASRAVGVLYRPKREYRLYIPLSASTDETVCLVWDWGEDRWTVYCGRPPWAPSAPFQPMRVTAATTVFDGEKERLYTGDPNGRLWLEDTGSLDDGLPIYSALVFGRLAIEGEGSVTTWRDIRVRARATGAPIKVAVLSEGAKFEQGPGAAPQIGQAWPALVTEKATGADETWGSWSMGNAVRARTVQPVLWCDGVDSAGVARSTRMAIRGIEIEFRKRQGRR